MKEINIDANI